MNKRTHKKGFTIVELVIVIAVIAILAAVLIPTFSGLIKKANLSADQQAVRQMNTLLAMYDAEDDFDNVADVIVALQEDNVDLENYKPMTADTYFYWVKSVNRVIHADVNGDVLYPEDLDDVTTAGWYSLSGEVPMDNSWTMSGTTATVSSGAQLVDLMSKLDSTAAAVKQVKLTESIDLKGSSMNFGKVTEDISLVADASDNVTIEGFRADTNTSVAKDQKGENKAYGYALFGNIPAGVTVTVENITLENVVIGDTGVNTKTGHSGIIAGKVEGELVVSNVTINNCGVIGSDKVGAIAGYVSGSGAKVKLTNVKVNNTVVAGHAFVAKAIGYVEPTAYTAGAVSIENCDFSGVTTKIETENWGLLWSTNGVPDKAWDGAAITPDTFVTANNGDTYVPWDDGNGDALTTQNNYWYQDSSVAISLTYNDITKTTKMTSAN